MEMPKILLPAGWSAERDCAHFLERWEPLPSYAETLWEMMRFHFGTFIEVLDDTLRCLGQEHPGPLHVDDPRCLTPAEKIGILQEIAGSSTVVAAYREELMELLVACGFAEGERQRVVKEDRLAGEHGWMYPLIEVIDYLGGAAFYFDALMAVESAGYRELTGRG